MTDEPAASPSLPEPAPPPERARVEPSVQRRWDLLPLLYLLGFLVLAGTLFFLWRHPPAARLAPQEASRVEGLTAQVQGLQDQVRQLQGRPAAAPGSASADVSQLQDRLTALENRPAPTAVQAAAGAAASPDLEPLQSRIAALEQRPVADLGKLQQRLDALEARPRVDLGPLNARVDQLAAQLRDAQTQAHNAATQARDAAGQLGTRLDGIEQRLAAVEGQAKQTAAALDAISRRAQVAARLQGASAALAAGQKLGDIPGAPPALARFANEAPPTDASLKLSFDRYAEEAQKASQPAIMDDKNFGARLWTRAQQVVTVRQGDRVLLGDPVAGVLAHAREALDAGDLAGAVKSLEGLAGPAAAAMKPWVDQARALLDARAAIASMAAG